jgi:hypothetical protein
MRIQARVFSHKILRLQQQRAISKCSPRLQLTTAAGGNNVKKTYCMYIPYDSPHYSSIYSTPSVVARKEGIVRSLAIDEQSMQTIEEEKVDLH